MPRLCSQSRASVAPGSAGHQCLGQIAQRGQVLLRPHVLFAVMLAKIRKIKCTRTAANGWRGQAGACRAGPALPSPPKRWGSRAGVHPPARRRGIAPGLRGTGGRPPLPAGGGAAQPTRGWRGRKRGGRGRAPAPSRAAVSSPASGAPPLPPAHKGPGRRGPHPHRSRSAAAAPPQPAASSSSLSSSASSPRGREGDGRRLSAGPQPAALPR